MRVSYAIPATIGVWVLEWLYFIMVGFDIIIHSAPFILIILTLLGVQRRKTKQTGFQQTPLISPLTAGLLSVVLISSFVMSIYYPSMILLLWNAQAMIAVVLAYQVTSFEQASMISKGSIVEML